MSDNKRRSISVRGTTYARLKAHCAAHNTTCSAVVEAMIEMALEAVRLADASLAGQPLPPAQRGFPLYVREEDVAAVPGNKTCLEPYGPKDRPDDASGPGRL